MDLFYQFLLGSGMLAAATWFLRKYMENGFAKDLEIFKSDTNRDIMILIEKMKSESRYNEIIKETSFPKIYARQLEVIESLYNNLLEMQQLCSYIVHGMEGNSNERNDQENFRLSFHKVKDVFFRSCIYLPKTLSDNILTVVNAINGVVHENMMIEMKLQRQSTPDSKWSELWEKKMDVMTRIDNDLPKLMDTLRSHIRKQFNVE